MNPVSFKTPAPERPAMAPRSDTAPKPPPATHFFPAVISFVSGGQVVALGNLNRKSQAEDVKVVFTTKHRGTDLPYLGFRVKLKREPTTSHLYESIAILFKYHNDCFDCVHHTATENEKENFLSMMLSDATCKEAVDNDKFYVNKFFKKENRGVEMTGHESSFIGADANIIDLYNHLSSVKACSVVTVWLFEYKNLAFHVQWALDHLQTAGPSLEPYYHHPLARRWTEHERSVPIATSQNSAAASATEKRKDSFPTQVEKKDQGPVG